MDKGIQKQIIKILDEQGGCLEWKLILETINNSNWKKLQYKKKEVVKHQMDLLEKEDKVLRKETLPQINYILTPAGHRELDPLLKKFINFFIYNTSNAIALLSVIIALGSLVVAVIALRKDF